MIDVLKIIIGSVLLTFVLAILANQTPFDDSDRPPNRSGLSVRIDARTGCHYLGNGSQGITPRLASDGRQICEAAR